MEENKKKKTSQKTDRKQEMDKKVSASPLVIGSVSGGKPYEHPS